MKELIFKNYQDIKNSYLQDVIANKPTAAVKGRRFYATDEDVEYLDDGSALHPVNMHQNDKVVLRMSADQSIGASTTKANFDTVVTDINGNFDPSTTKVNINKDTYYLINCTLYLDVTDGKEYQLHIYKNGVSIKRAAIIPGAAGSCSLPISALLELNTNDYIEIYAYFADTQSVYADSSLTHFDMVEIPLKF